MFSLKVIKSIQKMYLQFKSTAFDPFLGPCIFALSFASQLRVAMRWKEMTSFMAVAVAMAT